GGGSRYHRSGAEWLQARLQRGPTAGAATTVATSFPPPLRGRDRGGGGHMHRVCSQCCCKCCLTHGHLRFLNPPLPPSLSLPRRGGGNDVALSCPTRMTVIVSWAFD